MVNKPPPPSVLQAGDFIELKFPFTPQFNDTQTITPDGNISLQLVGEVKAAGKTRAQLRQELIKLYVDYLPKAELTVISRKEIQRRVYVGGEVIRPGPVDMPGNMTALQALMEAGGLNMAKASSKHILLIRQRDNENYAAALDMQDTLAGKKEQSIYLQPLDIVYVPRSTISKLNQWIDQYINRMVPQTGGLMFYPIGPGGLGRLGIDTSQFRFTRE